MKITFLGATGTVTGSKYLVETRGKKILVDCGLFQGLKELRLRNWDAFPFDPAQIDAVLLTHAHLDHSGAIPLLARRGYKGPVYCSEGTRDLCAILLPDSGYLQEEDATRANRRGYSKHNPALPLYTEQDARAALDLFRPVPFDSEWQLNGDLTFRLACAGHILGAAQIRLTDGRRRLLFSGDVGRPNDPIMKAPEPPLEADAMVIESTYGDRLHDASDPADTIAGVVRRTAGRGGSVIIPSFAVGRAQTLLYYLHQLKARKAIPDIPVYLDSPMAIDASDIMRRHIGDHRLTRAQCNAICQSAHYVHTAEESKALDHINSMPRIIISASGMATGGRVLHHLTHYMGDARNTILFAGYQAEGTRGDRLVRGEKEIKIHGAMWPVAAEIVNLANLSAHADYEEMLAWLQSAPRAPERVFITHGNAAAADALARILTARLGWKAAVPSYKQQETLS